MKYQLVLQFPEPREDPFDFIERLSEEIEANLKHVSDFDGHDIGQGEINFFIRTDWPEREFENLFNLLDTKELRAGYRDFDEDEYKSLFPHGSKFQVK